MQVATAKMARLDRNSLVAYDNRQLAAVASSKGEMVSGVQPAGFVRLKDERQTLMKAFDAARAQAIADDARLLIGKPLGDVILGI